MSTSSPNAAESLRQQKKRNIMKLSLLLQREKVTATDDESESLEQQKPLLSSPRTSSLTGRRSSRASKDQSQLTSLHDPDALPARVANACDVIWVDAAPGDGESLQARVFGGETG